MSPVGCAVYRRVRSPDETAVQLFRDLEDEAEIDEVAEEAPPPAPSEAIAGELARVESFVARARALPDDAKAQRFKDAIKVILDLGAEGQQQREGGRIYRVNHHPELSAQPVVDHRSAR